MKRSTFNLLFYVKKGQPKKNGSSPLLRTTPSPKFTSALRVPFTCAGKFKKIFQKRDGPKAVSNLTDYELKHYYFWIPSTSIVYHPFPIFLDEIDMKFVEIRYSAIKLPFKDFDHNGINPIH